MKKVKMIKKHLPFANLKETDRIPSAEDLGYGLFDIDDLPKNEKTSAYWIFYDKYEYIHELRKEQKELLFQMVKDYQKRFKKQLKQITIY